MKVFDRALIGFIGLCTGTLLAAAVSTPFNGVTKSPKAILNLPDAKIETASGGLNDLAARNNRLPIVTVSSLSATFTTLDYDFDIIREGRAVVPRLFVAAMPQDISRIRVPAHRKAIFFKTVLPLVLRVNDEILKDRRRLLSLRTKKSKYGNLPAADRLWLAAIAERYKTSRYNITELIHRCDIVPPSLALAQAAEESGWGTSRFVLEGNALFGQWTFAEENSLVPAERDLGRDHRIKAFTTLIDAVRAYARNLNTHRSYLHLRRERMVMRQQGTGLSGRKLTDTLTSYSERGAKYVQSIQSIISFNKLDSLDNARLGGKRVSVSAKPVI